MPIFDVRCADGHEGEQLVPRVDRLQPCRVCGSSVERIWKGRTPTVIDDSIPGGMVIENMSSTPLTFYSKSDYRREMKARGLVNKVEHVGVPGTDKSPMTSRWI